MDGERSLGFSFFLATQLYLFQLSTIFKYLFTIKLLIMSNFSKTQSISAFAQAQGISKIEILKNPKTGKRFVATDNGLTMRIAEKILQLDASSQVSWFTPDSGDASFMVHGKGEGAEVLSAMNFGAPAVANAPEVKADIESDIM
jgi:hypothetical protein